jgi:hypothetical protein
LEANGFFIDLVLASRLALREGLLRWVGEETCRIERRLFTAQYRLQLPIPTPDGVGWYLLRGKVVRFDLEWDRGTASLSRLRQKVRAAVRYFKATHDAKGIHLLYVLSSPARETSLRAIIQEEFDEDACRFWTTTVGRLDTEGPLGRIWCDAGEKEEDDDDAEEGERSCPPPSRVEATAEQRRLTDLAPYAESSRAVDDCIGKPHWWERRPGGAEVL